MLAGLQLLCEAGRAQGAAIRNRLAVRIAGSHPADRGSIPRYGRCNHGLQPEYGRLRDSCASKIFLFCLPSEKRVHETPRPSPKPPRVHSEGLPNKISRQSWRCPSGGPACRAEGMLTLIWQVCCPLITTGGSPQQQQQHADALSGL